MATSIEERKQRVASGSRRRRDLQAVGVSPAARGRERWQAEGEHRRAEREEEERRRVAREERLRPRVVASDQAQEAWGKVRAALVDCLPESTFGLWIDPLHLVGEVNGALWLDAPIRIAAWTERRYAHLIGDAIRGLSDYRGLYLGRQEEADKDDGLL